MLMILIIASFGFLISAQEGFDSANVFSENEAGYSSSSDNLTSEVAQRLSSALMDGAEDPQLSIGKLNEIINESLSQSFSESDLPEIEPGEIKIKKQNFEGMKIEQIRAIQKADFIDYTVAVYYIMATNSPRPITNSDEVSGIANFASQSVLTALTSRSSSAVNELANSGQRILTQLQDIEIPEDLLDIHIKAIKFAKYAIKLQPTINADTEDPLADLVNLSKLEGLAFSMFEFSGEIQKKFAEYEFSYDNDIKNKLEILGAPAPEVAETVDLSGNQPPTDAL